jgi:hypothetical protein
MHPEHLGLTQNRPAALPLQGASALARSDRCAGEQHAARIPCLTHLAVQTPYYLRRRALLGRFCVIPFPN